MSGYTQRAVRRQAEFIDNLVYSIRGSRERKDHKQAINRIQILRCNLMSLDADLRRAALDYYQSHKGQSYV